MGAVTFKPLTLAEFESMPEVAGKQEVDSGELLTVPPAKSLHARVAHTIVAALLEHLRGQPFKVLQEAGYLLSTEPLTYRQPDVSVLSQQRYYATDPDNYFQGAPEIAIEVVSPSDSDRELAAKAVQYLEHGALQAWVVYPLTKTVRVFSADSAIEVLEASGSITMAGVAVPVVQFFSL